jgi:choline dehydrogenase-like flavoprotein
VHGAQAWELMQRYNQMVVSGVLVEDSNSGTVSRSLFGMPVVRYDITALDHRRFLKGVKLLAEMHFALGAEYVILPFFNQHLARSVDELSRIDELQTDPSTLELFTPHLMGTARMGSRPQDSVVNLSGELWDLPGCYVADASLFPTAIGVNPQITIMALATRIAQRMRLARAAA